MPVQVPLPLAVVIAVFKDRADLVAENVALRHQLSCLKHRRKRPKLGPLDRALWAVLPTISFDILYVFFVLSVERRRILHFNATRHPTAEWTAEQVVEARPFEPPGRYLFLDNDKIYGSYFEDRVDGLGLEQVKTAFRSPWQYPYAERWIGGLRRDWLDHVIALNEDQLRRIVKSYVQYFHEDRTHLGLEKDSPIPRPVEPPSHGKIVALPRVGGLHHRYAREEKSAA